MGTTIRVQDLFYNTPARMKFLKKDSSEGTFVADTVTHVALSHPEVSVKFIREGKLQYVTPGDGQLRGAAYGAEKSGGRVPHHRSDHPAQKLPRQPQYAAFLHQWPLCPQPHHDGGHGDGVQGYHDAGQVSWRDPALEMPADLVDVNVHPAKTEVRFARENDIFDLVYHAVKLALAQPGTGERLFAFDADEKDEPTKKQR